MSALAHTACGSSESSAGRTDLDAGIVGDNDADGGNGALDVPDLNPPDVQGGGPDGSDEDLDSGPADDTADSDAPDGDSGSDATEVVFCTLDEECGGGYCLFLDPGASNGICTPACIDDEDCDEGEVCRRYSNVGADTVSVCVATDLCIDGDNDRFGFGPGCLGPDCDDADNDINLSATETCDGIDNDCDTLVDDATVDAGEDCLSGFPGICAPGRTVCEDGLLACVTTVEPAIEICDAIDNDCDGDTDEDPAGETLRRTCYSGPLATQGIGVCRSGFELCTAGAFGSCTDQILPVAESCDGLDNDCDGATDEDNVGAGLLCGTGRPGECAQGSTACVDGAVVCQPLNVGRPELCDGADNDCDGNIDNGNPGAGTACNTGAAGVCATGQTRCSGGGLVCEATVTPSDESCDGADNDCDGATDENNPGGGAACTTTQPGLCAAGTTTCAGGALACTPIRTPVAEACDGLDSDCDGATDEGCPTGVSLSGNTASPEFADLDGGTVVFNVPCPAGQAVVGFFGRSGGEVDAIGRICAPIALQEDTSTTPYAYRITTGAPVDGLQYGGGGGTAFRATCPTNQVVVGVNGRAADRIDGWQFTCASLRVDGAPTAPTVVRIAGTTSGYYGGSGGGAFSFTCTGNQVVNGIYGRSGGLVDSVAVYCGTPTIAVR